MPEQRPQNPEVRRSSICLVLQAPADGHISKITLRQKRVTPATQDALRQSFLKSGARTFSVLLLLISFLILALAVILALNYEPRDASDPGHNLVDTHYGVWTSLASMTASLSGLLTSWRTNRCNLAATGVIGMGSSAFGSALFALSTTGLIYAATQEEPEVEKAQEIVNYFNPFSITFYNEDSTDEDEEAKKIGGKKPFKLVVFSVGMTLGLVLGFLSTFLSMSAFRLLCGKGRERQQDSILFATRSEEEQRDGFVNIPLSSEMYSSSAHPESATGRPQNSENQELNVGDLVQASVDGNNEDEPPPKYEETIHI